MPGDVRSTAATTRLVRVRKKAALALGGIWLAAALAIVAARASAPTADSLLAWLQANDPPPAGEQFPAALATQFARLNPAERRAVLDREEFARAIRQLDAAGHAAFLERTVSGGIQLVLAATYAKPPAERRAFFNGMLATTRRVLWLEAEHVDRARLRTLVLRGIAAYTHEAGPEERLAMKPFIDNLHGLLEWL